MFGVTSIERYIVHVVSGHEFEYSVTGRQSDFIDKLCIKKCDGCNIECYDPKKIRIICDKSCALTTKSGRILIHHNERVSAIIKNGIWLDDIVFKCTSINDEICGFEKSMGGNMTYTSDLPQGILES